MLLSSRLEHGSTPSTHVWQHNENGIVARMASVFLLDSAVIKDIIHSKLAAPSHQDVYNITPYQQHDVSRQVEKRKVIDMD